MSLPVYNILCATDDKYFPYCGIMLTSVFENNKEVNVCVYIIIDKVLSANNQRKFRMLAKKYNQQIKYIIVDKSYLEKFPIKGAAYWSVATYYRLYAEQLLPKTESRVLYLDCDIIVTGSLVPLWQIDLTDKACATVPDIFNFSNECQNRLHYPNQDGYFNAGVMLINLEYWREYSIGQQCLNFLNEHFDWIFANDQDVLNAVLHNKKIDLPLKYNYQIQFLGDYFFNLQDAKTKEQIIETANHPVIMHYAYAIKPWSILYYKIPFHSLWMKYKRKSFWRLMPSTLPKRKTFNWLVKRFLLWPLGIINYRSRFIKQFQ